MKTKTLLIVLSVIATMATPALAGRKSRVIKRVESVNVECPAGTSPRLPWQIWVTYADKKGEWRQVKWSNSSSETERRLADAQLTPAGSTYDVRGYIIGDNTTSQGYPIDAHVKVTENGYTTPKNTMKAKPIPLTDVILRGKNRLTDNRALDVKNLLSLDVSQQLYNYRDTYGLPTEGYKMSDGWDSPTTKLKGHGTGHYLSALAFAYATESNKGIRELLFQRIERMVRELRECQERTFVYDDSLHRYREARDYAPEEVLRSMKGSWKAFEEYKKDYANYGYGYLNAIPAAHPCLIECYRAYNNEEWVWAPYYAIHKQLAGLIDIANCIDNKEIADKALLIARDMGMWVWNRMHYRTFVKTDGSSAERRYKPGNRAEMWNMYIAGEVGGMAESLSRLAEMVTDKHDKERLIEAAGCFDAPILFNNIAANIDDVRTRHANQHIPMFIGSLRSYLGNNNGYYYNLAYNFWEMMQGRYVYAMGGVGNGEMWRQPYTQMASMNTNIMSDGMGQRHPNPDINETCCAYNLAKLTKDLNCFNPDDARYMDYYERVLYNQIVGSLHPTEYGVCYQYAVGLDAQKPFGNATPQESCCGGTGAENHVKYQEAAYFTNDNTLWVGLYLPTEAIWREKGAIISQECEWPAEKSVIRIMPENGSNAISAALKLRVPYWATEGFDVKVNGVSQAKHYQPCSYFEISQREWTANDVVEVVMPYVKHVAFAPDKMDMAFTNDEGGKVKAFAPMWMGVMMQGPLVMTSPDIHTWEEATMDLSDLMATATVSDSHVGTRHFIPDYEATTRTTHYLRIKLPEVKRSKAMDDASEMEHLTQLIATAHERKSAQEAWEKLTVKVPEYAPWAPHGYARMMAALADAEKAVKEKGRTKGGEGLEAATLNVAILGMRPGNLAEPEDLNGLLILMKENGKQRNMSPQLRKALSYARMVVQYVNDGSGTKDMIRKAVSGLEGVK